MLSLTFPKAAVLKLYAHAQAATERAPTFEQLNDPKYHKKPLPPGQEFAQYEDINLKLIPPGLILVADHGLYLMSNASTPKGSKPRVEYAHEGHPRTNPDWYDTKLDMFGGDDTTLFIGENLLRSWLKSTTGDTLTITRVSDENLQLH